MSAVITARHEGIWESGGGKSPTILNLGTGEGVASFMPRLFKPRASGKRGPGNPYIGERVGSSQCASCGEERISCAMNVIHGQFQNQPPIGS